MKYTINWDGMYSSIKKSEFGEFDTFSEAKRVLIADLQDRIEDLKGTIRELRTVKKSDLEPELEE